MYIQPNALLSFMRVYEHRRGCVLNKYLLLQGCAVFLGMHARSSAVVLVQPLRGSGIHAEEETGEQSGHEEQDNCGNRVRDCWRDADGVDLVGCEDERPGREKHSGAEGNHACSQ